MPEKPNLPDENVLRKTVTHLGFSCFLMASVIPSNAAQHSEELTVDTRREKPLSRRGAFFRSLAGSPTKPLTHPLGASKIVMIEVLCQLSTASSE